jgi:hypothetical protein
MSQVFARFRRVRKTAIIASSCLSVSQPVFLSVRSSIHPHGTIRLLLDLFSLNFVFAYCSKLCRENSSFIKIWQEWRVLYTTTCVIYENISLNSFYNEKFSRPICRENQNINFIFNNFFRKSCRLWDNVEKYDRAGQATDYNIIRRMRFACWITKATDTDSKYAITYLFSTATNVKRKRLNITLYVHFLSCPFCWE